MLQIEKDGKVYFLKEGQMIGTTGIEVKSIMKNKVMLGYGDEEMELN